MPLLDELEGYGHASGASACAYKPPDSSLVAGEAVVASHFIIISGLLHKKMQNFPLISVI